MAGTWQRLVSTSADGNSTTLTTSAFTAKDNLHVVIYARSAVAGNYQVRFNGDASGGSSGNYATRRNYDGANEGSFQSSKFISYSATSALSSNMILNITNKSDKEKLVIGHCAENSTAGAGTAPNRVEFAGKWVNTSDQVTTITVLTNSGSNLTSDSYITVFGASSDTVTDERPSNIPANTRFEATNLRKIYRRVAGNATVETLNATNGTTNWSADTSKLTKSGNTITFSATGASNDEEIYYDLTSTSDDKWTLRFKADFTSIGAGNNAQHQQLQFGIYDSTNPSGNASGDVIMFYLSSAGNVSNAVNGVNGGTSDITSTNNTPIASSGSAVTYYIELQRTSSSAIQAKVFSDEYETQVGSTLSKTGLSGITGLRYLMVRLWGESGAGNGAVGSVTDMKFYNDTTTPLDDRWVERNTA